MYFSERNRKMLFPDYHSIAERRLVNHIIEEKRVKNLDDWANVLSERQLREF